MFGNEVTVLHSRMSPGERYDSWRRIHKGKTNVVIGARSALFAPLQNIGLIVIDEEHDSSYKQADMVPKYNARDSAIMLGSIENCPVLLGSATPSIESMYNAKLGKYELLQLSDRIDDAKTGDPDCAASVKRYPADGFRSGRAPQHAPAGRRTCAPVGHRPVLRSWPWMV